MAKKTDAFYFDNLVEVAEICVDAARYLESFLTTYEVAGIRDKLSRMHEYEHAADEKKHEMFQALSKAFITPIEREDLAELSDNLDEVADNIEAVMQRFYVDEPGYVTDESVVLARLIVQCCVKLREMFLELHNFKKPARLLAYVKEVNDLEEECDRIHLEAYRGIRYQSQDVMEMIAYRKIYDYLEQCADACEHVAEAVNAVVMKNT